MKVIDIIIITCIGLYMYRGYQRGFIWSFIELTSYFFSALLANWFHHDVAFWLRNNTGLYGFIESFIDRNFYNIFDKSLNNPMEVDTLGSSSWRFLGEYLLKNAEVETYVNQTIEAFKTELISGVTSFLLKVISMILIFLVAKSIIIIVGLFLNQVFKLPVLSTLNKSGGVLLGGIKGIFLIMVIAIIVMIFSVISPGGLFVLLIENSLILKELLKVFFSII